MVYIERIDRVFAGERWGDTSRKAAGDRVQIGKSHAYNIITQLQISTVRIYFVQSR